VNRYMKLGLMGVTIVYSSGDYGVAGNGNQCCYYNNCYGGYLNAPNTGGAFSPSFPASVRLLSHDSKYFLTSRQLVSICNLRGSNPDCPGCICHCRRGSLRNSHLLWRWLQQPLCNPELSDFGSRDIFQETQAQLLLSLVCLPSFLSLSLNPLSLRSLSNNQTATTTPANPAASPISPPTVPTTSSTLMVS